MHAELTKSTYMNTILGKSTNTTDITLDQVNSIQFRRNSLGMFSLMLLIIGSHFQNLSVINEHVAFKSAVKQHLKNK